MKILLLESKQVNYVELPLIEQDILGCDYQVEWLSHFDLTRDRDKLAIADGIIVFDEVQINSTVIDSLSKCKAIIIAADNYQAIDLRSATERGIFVANVPDVAIDEIVEHTFAFILSAQRKIMLLQKCVNKNNWNWRDVGAIYSSANLTLGLIGYGKIARKIAARAKSFGYQVIYFDPNFISHAQDIYAISVNSLEELLTHSDIVTLHLSLNEYTYHIINKQTLKYMKKTAILINTSNGKLIENAALLNALKRRKISQVCLDNVEEGSKITKLWKNNPRVIITPHVASCSKQSLFRLRVKAALALKKLLTESGPQQGRLPRATVKIDTGLDQQCGTNEIYPIKCVDHNVYLLRDVL